MGKLHMGYRLSVLLVLLVLLLPLAFGPRWRVATYRYRVGDRVSVGDQLPEGTVRSRYTCPRTGIRFYRVALDDPTLLLGRDYIVAEDDPFLAPARRRALTTDADDTRRPGDPDTRPR